jgi:hypothetical protein
MCMKQGKWNILFFSKHEFLRVPCGRTNQARATLQEIKLISPVGEERPIYFNWLLIKKAPLRVLNDGESKEAANSSMCT